MDVMGNQAIQLVVSEIALSLSGINELLNVVKSQAESLQHRPAWSKGFFVDSAAASSTETAGTQN
jgi:hypothetical protein